MSIEYSAIGAGPASLNSNTVASFLYKQLLEENTIECLYSLSKEGYHEKSGEEIIEFVNSLGGKQIHQYAHSGGRSFLFKWNDGFLSLNDIKNKYVSLHGHLGNQDVYQKILKYTETLFVPLAKKGYVFAITRTDQGSLQISKLGNAGIQLEKENYSSEIIEDYNYAISDLKTEYPSGKIVLLDGPPGSGKTHIVRSFLNDVPDATFIIIQPSMVASLSGPDLLPLLINNRQNYPTKKGPIILLLEDADEVLVPRKIDNMSSISSLLNVSDGILGSLFDIRLIATTNAKKMEIDEAILRDGRLSKRINVGYLNLNLANKIYQRLLKDDSKILKLSLEHEDKMKPKQTPKIVLGNVYKMARDSGWVPEVKNKEPIELDDDIPVDFSGYEEY